MRVSLECPSGAVYECQAEDDQVTNLKDGIGCADTKQSMLALAIQVFFRRWPRSPCPLNLGKDSQPVTFEGYKSDVNSSSIKLKAPGFQQSFVFRILEA